MGNINQKTLKNYDISIVHRRSIELKICQVIEKILLDSQANFYWKCISLKEIVRWKPILRQANEKLTFTENKSFWRSLFQKV